MNELPTIVPNISTQRAFSQDGRKGVAYDWQSLCNVETVVALRELEEFLTSELELATVAAE